MIKTVGIVGLGAVGILYGLEFQKVLGVENVHVIADAERIQRYKKEGFWANGQPCEFHYVPSEDAEPVDLLIFATKYHGLRDAVHSARKACGPDTIVMSFLNGVVSEGVIEEMLHPNHLLYTTIQGMDATKTGNKLFCTKRGSITFGERDNRITPQVQAVDEFLTKVGFPTLIPEDIMQKLWSKWMLNVGVNQSCAVYAVTYSGVHQDGEPRTAMLTAMEEARQVANAEGIPLTRDEAAGWVALIDTLAPDGEPSMRQDTREGRQTEVDLFAGTVCSLAVKHGIDVPQNQWFLEKLQNVGK